MEGLGHMVRSVVVLLEQYQATLIHKAKLNAGAGAERGKSEFSNGSLGKAELEPDVGVRTRPTLLWH